MPEALIATMRAMKMLIETVILSGLNFMAFTGRRRFWRNPDARA
jgi:hypothetical protein